MDKQKRERVEAAGWTVGTAREFLGLSDAEAAIVEIKLGLSDALKARRLAHGVSQGELAKLGSSQSRVAKMESADPTVSIELLLRGLFTLGATVRDVANVVSKPARRA